MSITADQLVVAVSSRALFDLEKEHQLFEKEGYEAFKDYQVEHCVDWPEVNAPASIGRL